MEETSELRPMEFGEILGKGWELTRRTMSTAGLISIVYALIVCLVLWWFMGDIMRLMEFSIAHSGGGMRRFSDFPVSLFMIYPLSALNMLVTYFLIAVTLIASWEAINDNDVMLGTVTRRAVARPMWYLLLQNLAFGAVLGVAYVILLIVGMLLALATKGLALIVMIPVIVVVVLAVVVAITFAPYEVVVNGRGPIKSLQASYNLVRGNWGRVIGIHVVLGILGAIVVGIAAIPMMAQFFTFINEAVHNMPAEGRSDPAQTAAAMREFIRAFPSWTIPLIVLAGSLFTLFQRNVLMAAFVDLRARRGDFTGTADDADLGFAE